MRHVLLFFCITLLFVCCNPAADTLPGLYVSTAALDFGIVQDSLFVKPSGPADQYVISRRTMIDYTRNEERLPQHRSDEWIALYDSKTNILSVQQNGKILYLDEEKNGIMMGKTLFKKIDDAKNVDDLVSRNH